MKRLHFVSYIFGLCLLVSELASAKMVVVWERDFDWTEKDSIKRVKLTPDGNSIVVFHIAATHGVPTPVQKLDAVTGEIIWDKTITKPGKKISYSGWVDNGGNLYITSGWGGYTIWKYSVNLDSELWSYTGGTGFEYVDNVITDELNNVYVAGHYGSGSGQPSAAIKLDSVGNLVWQCLSGGHPGGKDRYTLGLGLDSNENLFRVGHDLPVHGARTSSWGRLIGHDATDGHEILNRLVDEPNSEACGVIVDGDDNIYIGYSYNLWQSGVTPSYNERSVVQKLDQQGNSIWKYVFDDVGTYFSWGCIVKRTDDSFYVGYNLRKDGAVFPGIAQFNLDGEVRWRQVLDKPGWFIGGSGIDADRSYIYIGLDNLYDNTVNKVLCLKCSIMVEMDIKPGSYPNSINLGSQGLIPVAILSSQDFDATTVDPDTVELAGADVAVRGKGNKYLAHQEDVDEDGLMDLVVQVATANLDPNALQDGYAVLTGSTFEGQDIEGEDEITIVPAE